MSILDRPEQLRQGHFGEMVTEPAKVLPATGLANIFNVNNGPVLITSLTGLVTVALSATATTITVGVTPTGGASAPAALASAGTVTSLAVGAYVTVAPFATAAAVALQVSPASGVLQGGGVGAVALNAAGVSAYQSGLAIVSAGVITITTSATNTGSMSWTCTYIPLVVGANITAV